MGRAIHPFHTADDGDILYAVTTGEIGGWHLSEAALGIMASEVVWDAVLSIVEATESQTHQTLVC